MNRTNYNQNTGLTQQVWDFSDLVVKTRFARALEEGAARYPIYRELRFAARMELKVLLDAIALDPAWRAERIHAESLMLDGDGLFVAGVRKPQGGLLLVHLLHLGAGYRARRGSEASASSRRPAATRITEPMFTIDWHFLTAQGDVESAEIEEMADDELRRRARTRRSKGGVHAFIARYSTRRRPCWCCRARRAPARRASSARSSARSSRRKEARRRRCSTPAT